MTFFKVINKSKITGSRARVGTITTAHGHIQTPAFVSVGTKGTIKAITCVQAKSLGIQASFVNSYHLVTHPGSSTIRAHNSVHDYSGMNWPLMSDSGGFQIFSLAQRSKRGKMRSGEEAVLVSIKEDEVVFRSIYNGELIKFSPELSMDYQIDIGADMCMAFDECVYYGATQEYAMKSMQMTHRWLVRSIQQMKNSNRDDYQQYLYGIIQGATFENLRIESARYVTSLDTPGVAIGGVSVGETKEELRNQVRWVSPYLPDDRPVHLLGVGHLDDILDLVAYGVDTFDCVEPTRLARLGVLVDIENLDGPFESWEFLKTPVTDLNWRCDTSKLSDNYPFMKNTPELHISKSYIHHLFKQKELLGYTLATIYNLSVMEAFMGRIRGEIETGRI